MVNFLEIVEREAKQDYSATATIDGYSTAKTLLGVMRDIEREFKKIDSLKDFSSWYSCVSNKEAEELLLSAKDSGGGFYMEVEEVSGASQMNEDTDEMEYKDGNFYFCTRIVR
jgi:hypothetical protein